MFTVTIPSPTGTVATDTWKLQTLVNSLPNNGGIVQMPSDVDYTINSPLLVRSNITIEGNNCRLIANNALNNSVIRSYHPDLGNQNITIRNLRIAGNRANQSHSANPAHAIAFYSTHGILVEDVTIDDVELDGLYVGGSEGSLVSTITIQTFCSNVVFRNCEITNCYRNAVSITNARYVDVYNIDCSDNNKGVVDSSQYLAASIDLEPNELTDHCFEIYIHDNIVDANQAPAIGVQGSSNKDHCYIYSNTITQETLRAIAVYTPITFTEVYDNTITCVNASGIWFNGQGSNITDVEIYDNVVSGDDTNLLTGIGLGYVTSNTPITNNTITDFNKAVLLANNSVATINNNNFVSCTTAIDSTSGSSYSQSGNVIT